MNLKHRRNQELVEQDDNTEYLLCPYGVSYICSDQCLSSLFLKELKVGAVITCVGRLFQAVATRTGKEFPLTVSQ